MVECVYLTDRVLARQIAGQPVRHCLLHGECILHQPPEEMSYPVAQCDGCRDTLSPSSPQLSEKFVDPLRMRDSRNLETTALRNLLRGATTFLVCGGPSLKHQDLTQLERRGVWSLAVNNAAGLYRPSAFICADPPSKFHNGIWLDPQVMKFIPIPKLSPKRGKLRWKTENGFQHLDTTANDAPNVWGFDRRSWMAPDDSFFLDPQAAWGNHNDGVLRTGESKTVCTMLLAVRMLYYLGSRTIFLLGVDFGMSPEHGYAFNQARDQAACDSNNQQFSIVNDWLCRMQNDGVFSRFGLKIFNCNQHSGLRAFPYVPYDAAVRFALRNYPVEPFDLSGWYEKG